MEEPAASHLSALDSVLLLALSMERSCIFPGNSSSLLSSHCPAQTATVKSGIDQGARFAHSAEHMGLLKVMNLIMKLAFVFSDPTYLTFSWSFSNW